MCPLRPAGAARLLVVRVEGFAGQGQVGLAERLVLRRVGVDELSDLGRQRLGVVDQLCLTTCSPMRSPTMWTPTTAPSLSWTSLISPPVLRIRLLPLLRVGR